MENGDADGYYLSFLAAAGAAPEDDYGDRAFADGQWKCRLEQLSFLLRGQILVYIPVSYTHLRAHETVLDLV